MCGPSATIVLVNHSLSLGTTQAGGDAAIDAAGAEIDGLRAVAVFDAVVNLAFVAVGEFARNAAEEEAAVEARGVADALPSAATKSPNCFSDSSTPRPVLVTWISPLSLTVNVLLLSGWFFQPVRSLPLNSGSRPSGFSLMFLNSTCAGVELQADVAAADRGGIGVFQDRLAVELDGALAAVERGLERLPLAGPLGHFLAFQAADEAAGGERIVGRGDVQLVALRLDVVHADDRRGPQEDAAVGALRRAEVGLEHVVVELHARAEQALARRALTRIAPSFTAQSALLWAFQPNSVWPSNRRSSRRPARRR